MKNFYSYFIFMTFFISCTTDSDLSKAETFSSNERSLTEMPANSDNPYDAAGRLYTELFDAYYVSDTLPTTIPDIAARVELLGSANTEFSGLKTTDYHAVSPDRIQYILAHPNTIVQEIITGSAMTTDAKSSLSIFSSALSLLYEKEQSDEVLYNFVADYEAAVLTDSQFTETDKRVILITTSIARYSSCKILKRPKKNTDPNWVLTTSNIIAGTEGADYGMAEAITKALATGIAANQ
jgi:hypothetical protein